MQNAEPGSLYCADESDGESAPSLRADHGRLCMASKRTAPTPVPMLATGCTSNDDLTVWTCTLRDGVKFQDGSDVHGEGRHRLAGRPVGCLSPLHKGANGIFSYWPGLWGGFLNPPAPCGIEGQPACTD